MNVRSFIWRTAFLASFIITLAASRPIPILDVAQLTKKADVIAVGEATSVQESGNTIIDVEYEKVPARAMIAEVRADQVLKGPSESLLKVRFFLPEAPVGYQSIRPLSYRLFFLKNSGNYYEFVSPYCPSIVAAPGIRAQGNSVLDRVVGQVAGVLQSPRSPIEQKREAVYVLSRTESPAATIALRPGLREEDIIIQLGAAAALLEHNDISGLQIAEQALLNPNKGIPAYLLHNLSYAISEGLQDERAIPALTRLLQAHNIETRRAAASALRHTASHSAIPPLIAALQDSDFEVRYYSVIGLAEITGQNEWRPNMDDFRSKELRYLNYWRDWGRTRN